MMEVIKDIAAVIGGILSAVSLIILLSKPARKFAANIFVRIFKKYGDIEPVHDEIAEIKKMLEKHIDDEKEFKESVIAVNEINIEFMRTTCRNIIKNTFYKYKDTKILPLYEKKTLMIIEPLYIEKLNGNSFAALLLKEMADWEVDYDGSHPNEYDDV